MFTAIIAGAATVIGAIISGIVALIVSEKQHDKTIALVEYRLTQLETKVDKHNNLVERMTLAEEKIKVANHRIEDLERSANITDISPQT